MTPAPQESSAHGHSHLTSRCRRAWARSAGAGLRLARRECSAGPPVWPKQTVVASAATPPPQASPGPGSSDEEPAEPRPHAQSSGASAEARPQSRQGRLISHGYVNSKLSRARLLHAHICHLIGEHSQGPRSCPPGSVQACLA